MAPLPQQTSRPGPVPHRTASDASIRSASRSSSVRGVAMERGGSRRGDVTKEQERKNNERILTEAGDKMLRDPGRKGSDRQLQEKHKADGQENIHFSIIVRCPFRRGSFEEPGPVVWDADKDEQLWSIVSGAAKSADLNWEELADHFEVSLTFMLQQAAWLYERHLSHVRAQMKRRQVQPSTVNSTTTAGGLAMKRGGSNTGRAPSVLSRESPKADTSAPPTPRMGVEPPPPMSRNPSTTTVTQSRPIHSPSSPRPTTAQLNRESHPRVRAPLASAKPRSPSSPSSPSAASSSSESSSDEDTPGPLNAFRRPPTFKPHRSALGKAMASSAALGKPYGDSENEESSSDESPSGLLFVTKQAGQSHDPSATLRSGLPRRPRRSSEATETGTGETRPPTDKGKGKLNTAQVATKGKALPSSQPTDSSASSASSAAPLPGFVPVTRATIQAQTAQARARAGGTGTNTSTGSPTSSGAGSRHLRRPSARGPGSEGGTSMGSSFSDLDDPSVTQSALEEALLQAGQGGVASKMSSLSQALRSRYL